MEPEKQGWTIHRAIPEGAECLLYIEPGWNQFHARLVAKTRGGEEVIVADYSRGQTTPSVHATLLVQMLQAAHAVKPKLILDPAGFTRQRTTTGAEVSSWAETLRDAFASLGAYGVPFSPGLYPGGLTPKPEAQPAAPAKAGTFARVELDAEQVERSEAIRLAYAGLEQLLLVGIEPGRRRSLALTALEESAMWAQKAIAHGA
jgi:hypothetical protein